MSVLVSSSQPRACFVNNPPPPQPLRPPAPHICARLRSLTTQLRGTLKMWQKFWCVLRPGLLLYFKDSKRDDWMGTILLSGGEVRPLSPMPACARECV